MDVLAALVGLAITNPICDECGERMRILNPARLGYVTTTTEGGQ